MQAKEPCEPETGSTIHAQAVSEIVLALPRDAAVAPFLTKPFLDSAYALPAQDNNKIQPLGAAAIERSWLSGVQEPLETRHEAVVALALPRPIDTSAAKDPSLKGETRADPTC